jgi:hypothetical protein
MRQAKAAGVIARIPGGRRAKGLPKLSKDRKIRRAQRMLEAAMAKRNAEKATVPMVAQRSWVELEKPDKLSEATDQSLDKVYTFLLMDLDPVVQEKLFLAQQQVALSTISNQIRLDAAKLQAQTSLHNLPDEILRERLAAAFERLDALPDVIEDDDVGTG